MDDDLAGGWEAYCHRSNYGVGNRRAAVRRCLDADGVVRGWYSDLPLDPMSALHRSMYPSLDHRTHPKDDREMVVEGRVINNMKSNLTESEFWRMIEHLYAVGVAKGTIPPGPPRRLADDWSSIRHFDGQR